MHVRTSRPLFVLGLLPALLGVGLAVGGPQGNGAVAPANAADSCAVAEAELRWGVKERFRNYISGSIANGEWVTEGSVEYATPEFTWSGGLGTIADDLSAGTVLFTGDVYFSGHEGLMQLGVANPRIEFTSSRTADLLLDMAASVVAGGELVYEPVIAATIDLAGADTGDGTRYSIDAAPVSLTEAGAKAFNNKYGDYAPGELFDPLSLSFTTAGCEIVADTGIAVSPEQGPQLGEPGATDDGSPEIPWALIGVGGGALMVVAVTAGMLLAGRGKKSVDDANGADSNES